MKGLAGAAILAALALCADTAQAADALDQLDRYVEAAAHELPQLARDTLTRIDARDRRLLALRAYLRAGPSLEARWSWSDAQIAAFHDSAEYRAALAEVGKIGTRFAADNPGYSVYVNTEVRSLDLQLTRWATNASVGTVARALERAARVELNKTGYAVVPDAAAAARWRMFLTGWFPARPANLAAPGLSPHGQARAFDFQIRRDGVTVAGTDSTTIATVWDGQGWARRLEAAVRVSDKFVGPLAAPREPWHYEYRP